MRKMKKTHCLVAAVCLGLSCFAVPVLGAGSGGSSGGMAIYDGAPTEADCRMCHDNLAGFPMLLATNPDRHHALSTDCLSCHPLVWNEVLAADVVSFTGNCLDCHEAASVEGSPATANVHHQTATFLARDCAVCHIK